MKKIITLIIIIALLTVVFVGCGNKLTDKEQTIVDLALLDINEAGSATLEFVDIKPIPWSDWDSATYVMTVNGHSYVVSVQEKGDEIHFVDVVDKLK